MTSRRTFLSAGCFLAGMTAGGGAVSWAGRRASAASPLPAPKTRPQQPRPSLRPRLVLSLRAYQEELKQTVNDGEIPELLRSLRGLNRIDAILLEGSSDVLLAGDHDPALPAMELADLLVALRNAYANGADYQGSPGCTIDPMPGVADPWRVQLAKVFGMPASAPMGVRHVEIDYELKKVSAGLQIVSSAIPSMYQATVPCGAQDASTGPKSSTHRFWFTPRYPDRPRFIQDEEGFWIEKPIQVQLQSEEEFLQDGRRVGGASPQPAAVKFTEAVTRVLATNEVANYAHLRNDFRLIEAMRLLAYAKVPPDSLNFLLEACPLRHLPVRDRVTGIRRAESGEATCGSSPAASMVAGAGYIERYRQEFRGGVEAPVEIEAVDFRADRAGELAQLRQRVQRAAQSGKSLLVLS